MSDIQITQDNTEKVLEALPIAMLRGLEEIGLVAEGYAKKLCPVDTGRLRNSITHTIGEGDMAAFIGTNVEYAGPVEYGHRSYPGANDGRGYLRPAATEHGSEYRGILEKHMKDA